MSYQKVNSESETEYRKLKTDNHSRLMSDDFGKE